MQLELYINAMIAIITGDIISSQKGDVRDWLTRINDALSCFGKKSRDWEIYRGDSFQLRLEPEKALFAAFYIKSLVRQSELHDVRMAIGLGGETYKASKVSESNGSAYVSSGKCFENLKKCTLALCSGNDTFDEVMNLMLDLYLNNADTWTVTVSRLIQEMLSYPEKSQKQLALDLGKSQSSISEAMKRGNYDGLLKVLAFYEKQIKSL